MLILCLSMRVVVVSFRINWPISIKWSQRLSSSSTYVLVCMLCLVCVTDSSVPLYSAVLHGSLLFSYEAVITAFDGD